MASGYEASPTEVQSVVLEWARAAEAFHLRYAKLNALIGALTVAAQKNPADSRSRLCRLIELREHMSDALMILLQDMSGRKTNRSKRSSKHGQLHSHACLLDELNRKIDAELMIPVAVAQA